MAVEWSKGAWALELAGYGQACKGSWRAQQVDKCMQYMHSALSVLTSVHVLTEAS